MNGAEQIQPTGDRIKKAVKWLSQIQNEHPDKNRLAIIRDAVIRFNLTPKESEFLENKFSK